MIRRPLIAAVTALAVILPAGIDAQKAFDRKDVPAPGKTPELRVPTWTKATLANGADLIVSEKHDLPLVSFSITFLGGANQFEPADRAGLASLTAAMMSEGTTTRDGEALSNALQLLGTSVSTSIAAEGGSMAFVSTTAKFSPTLDVLADMLLNPVFPADALERHSRPAPRGADAGPGAARRHRRPRVPARPLRPNPSIRARRRRKRR